MTTKVKRIVFIFNISKMRTKQYTSNKEDSMRRETLLMKDWRFSMPGAETEVCDLPHTRNAVDGQDGGNDYLRTACVYEKTFAAPDYAPEKERVFLVYLTKWSIRSHWASTTPQPAR